MDIKDINMGKYVYNRGVTSTSNSWSPGVKGVRGPQHVGIEKTYHFGQFTIQLVVNPKQLFSKARNDFRTYVEQA